MRIQDGAIGQDFSQIVKEYSYDCSERCFRRISLKIGADSSIAMVVSSLVKDGLLFAN